MKNAGLGEIQAGIKIAGRNINNRRYADDITLMAENFEELKSLLMRVRKESEKAGLKLNLKKLRSWQTKIMANRRGKTERSDRFYFLWLQNRYGW